MANPAEKPIKEPKVDRYNRLSNHRCPRFRTGNCWRNDALDAARSFMPNQAAKVATSRNGTHIQAAFSSHSWLPSGC